MFADMKNYYSNQKKHGLLYGLDTVWNTITGNLIHNNDCITKSTHDEYHIENY